MKGLIATFLASFLLATPQVFADDKVKVDLFVMSRCPDAQFCTSVFDDVANQVGNIMDLNLNYITKNDPGQPLVCMHGNSECVGNQQQLCARELYPEDWTWWKFALCQFKDYAYVPSNAKDCAGKTNVDYQKIQDCATSTGVSLLTKSSEYAQEKEMVKSCSVRIADELVCIRDGYQWYSCPSGSEVSDFVRQICDKYTGAERPAACSAVTLSA